MVDQTQYCFCVEAQPEFVEAYRAQLKVIEELGDQIDAAKERWEPGKIVPLTNRMSEAERARDDVIFKEIKGILKERDFDLGSFDSATVAFAGRTIHVTVLVAAEEYLR